jgi:hypothetical protein
MLSQIEACRLYAKRTGRQLLIDCSYSPIFIRGFDSVFTESESVWSMYSSQKIRPESAVFPLFLQGCLNSYRTIYLQGRGLVEEVTREQITFDMHKHYPHEVLVYHQVGGGLRSTKLLRHLKLTSEVLKAISLTVMELPKDFTCIHVRNTDLKPKCLEIMLPSWDDAPVIVVASDSPATIEELRAANPRMKFIPLGSGKLDDSRSPQDAVDLFVMPLAARMETLQINGQGYTYSGYGRLAKYLWLVLWIRRNGWLSFIRRPTQLSRGIANAKTSIERLAAMVLIFFPRLISDVLLPRGVFQQLTEIDWHVREGSGMMPKKRIALIPFGDGSLGWRRAVRRLVRQIKQRREGHK